MSDPRYEGLSPREELYERALRTWLAKDVHTMGAARALVDAFEADVLREAAEKIRARAAERSASPRDQLGSSECRDDWAADLIDPDKEGS